MTDVIDSTRLTERLDAVPLAALWERHDRDARRLLRRWRGREIDSSDGFLLIFDDASDALDFALAYQIAVTTLDPPLAARAGLHVGAIVLRKNDADDVRRGAKPVSIEGAAKPLAARVCALAAGGQTLVTADARAALTRPAAGLLDLHWWRLKGLEGAVHLYEPARVDRAPTDLVDTDKAWRVVRRDGTWLPMREQRHSLPRHRDAFVGRHDALLELQRRFDDGTRLVSLLGTGGVGKTRLAQRFGWNELGAFPGGVWFCDLAAALTLEGLCHAVAIGLDIRLGEADPLRQIADVLATRERCLVILDNFEQVVDHAEAAVGRWLDMPGDSHFLVTSRERLGIAGEVGVDVQPLTPVEAARLFRHRAATARNRPQAESDDDAIAPLVALLDGLPLAIELAAARANVMSIPDMLARMTDRFALLVSGRAHRPRQATLRSAFDWSWGLLSPIERSALAQSSLFEGGFSLAAAEAVIELGAGADLRGDSPAVADLLQRLVDQSLARRRDDGRFGLLVSIRQYAAQQLSTPGRFPGSGPSAVAAAAVRHSTFFAAMDENEATADGCADLDNLVVACTRAVDRGATGTAIGALESAWAALHRRGPFVVGLRLAESVCAMPLDRDEEARAARTLGWILQKFGRNPEAEERLQHAVSLAAGASAVRTRAHALSLLGDLHTQIGATTLADAELDRALDLARSIDDRTLECEVMSHLGLLYLGVGRLAAAGAAFDRSLELARVLRDRRRESTALTNRGVVCENQGLIADAAAMYERSLAIDETLGDRQGEGVLRLNLGWIYYLQDRHDDAHASFVRALSLSRETGHARLRVAVHCNLGIVEEARGNAMRAVTAYEEGLTAARLSGDRRAEGQLSGYLGLLHAREREFDLASPLLSRAEGLLGDDRLCIALLRCQRAEAALLASHSGEAERLLEAASASACELGAGADSELGLAVQRVRRLLAAVPP